MTFERSIEPEWLDELAPQDPRALRSRRDLRRINTLMMNAAIIGNALARCAHRNAVPTIAEIGAGDGTLMLTLAKRVAAASQPVKVILVDRHDIVSAETRIALAHRGWQLQCVANDVFAWFANTAQHVDVIIANLFLHHFDGARLRALLSLIAERANTFIACEPRRSRAALAASRMLGFIGCNDVSRHDAVISVRAGFCDSELSALWPADARWMLEERARGVFSHAFIARRVHDDHDVARES